MSKSPEHILQCQIVSFLRLSGYLVFAVPNGGGRNIIEASRLKKEGVLAGVSDLIIVMQNKIVFVELKAKGNKQQESQVKFQKDVEKLGHEYLLWYDLKDADNFIKENRLTS